MAIRVKRQHDLGDQRSDKLKMALKQGRSAEAETVLTAGKTRIDTAVRNMRTSLKNGPVRVVAKPTGAVKVHTMSLSKKHGGFGLKTVDAKPAPKRTMTERDACHGGDAGSLSRSGRRADPGHGASAPARGAVSGLHVSDLV